MTVKEINNVIHRTREVECMVRNVMQSEIEYDYPVLEALQEAEEVLQEIRNLTLYLFDRVSL